jgi:hypothetical protein
MRYVHPKFWKFYPHTLENQAGNRIPGLIQSYSWDCNPCWKNPRMRLCFAWLFASTNAPCSIALISPLLYPTAPNSMPFSPDCFVHSLRTLSRYHIPFNTFIVLSAADSSQQHGSSNVSSRSCSLCAAYENTQSSPYSI